MEEYAATKNETRKHILEVGKLMNEMVVCLLNRASAHDATKLGPEEAPYFDEFTPKLSQSTYGSEEYKSFLSQMKPAIDHHQTHNDHHPEYFPNGIRGMSLLSLVEMLSDWKAATKRHNDGDIRRSIEITQSRFGYSDELKDILLNTLEEMNW